MRLWIAIGAMALATNAHSRPSVADFKKAFQKAMAYEVPGGGHGWEQVPGDTGGETYMGISRKWHGRLGLWTIVDSAKKSPEFPRNLKGIPSLQEAVEDFYLDTFWYPLRGDRIKSQAVADELYECAVNQGPAYAVQHLQNALQLLGYDVTVDGSLGPQTIDVLNTATARGQERDILRIQNTLQGARYVEIMQKNPSQRKFLGWFARV